MAEGPTNQIGKTADRSESPNPADIVEELRWQKRYTNGRVPYTMERAAKEIERLRAQIAAPPPS